MELVLGQGLGVSTTDTYKVWCLMRNFLSQNYPRFFLVICGSLDTGSMLPSGSHLRVLTGLASRTNHTCNLRASQWRCRAIVPSA